MNFLSNLFGLGERTFPAPCVMGDESIMAQKSHGKSISYSRYFVFLEISPNEWCVFTGTSETPVQEDLRWSCDAQLADRICNFNRHGAERLGYFLGTPFADEAKKEYEAKGEVTFYDSNTGKPLFVAPKGRSFEKFLFESASHGWPSFRDDEVVWENVRCLPDGETISVDGTHLGHNLPDFGGSRYCINLVSVAGTPTKDE